ncbi:MAG: HDIG domain-containing protein [Fusobacteria bacterium]|nr:HDIG domain-containing protein [Fusobacteriota bacterium]
MRTIKMLGKKISIKVESTGKESSKLKKLQINYKLRLIFIALIFIFFVFFFNIGKAKKEYEIGNISESTILSPLSIEYEDKFDKDFVVEQIKMNTQPIYTIDHQVKINVIKNLNSIFDKYNMFKKNLITLSLKTESEKENLYNSFFKDTNVQIDFKTIKKMLEEDNDHIIKSNLLKKIDKIYENGIEETELNLLKNEIKNIFSEVEYDIFSKIILPDKFYDEESTKENIAVQLKNIEVKKVKINFGDIIISKGEVINEEIKEKLDKTGVLDKLSYLRKIFGICLYFICSTILFMFLGRKYIKKEIIENKIYFSTLISICIMLFFLKIIPIKLIFLFPFGFLILILGIISTEKYAFIIGGTALIYILPYMGFDQLLFIVNLTSMLIAIYYVKQIKNRSDIINAGIYMGLIKTVIGSGFCIIFSYEAVDIIWIALQLLLSGIAAGMLTISILPYLENYFNILTNIKLLELGDFSNPLLKELLMKAPGTFHHSLLVATLAENAAEAIGANSTFTRVACYYHDIGKTKRPTFFVENQFYGVNPHDTLNPYLSALIIRSHTKDGEKIARMHKIPKEVRDIMSEHQGTTLLAYFYNKAKNDNPDINESDFRYDGPKPRTKESAIIMLADSIEAAVRSLDHKNPVIVESLIRKIINGKIEEDQLSEAELTFKDIEIVIKTFLNVIQGIYHSRIKYPEIKK